MHLDSGGGSAHRISAMASGQCIPSDNWPPEKPILFAEMSAFPNRSAKMNEKMSRHIGARLPALDLLDELKLD
jgi:hypothetical protein